MKLTSNFTNSSGEKVFQTYFDGEDLVEVLDKKNFGGSHAYCFCGDKLVLVNHPKGGWMPPGGGMEEGESVEQTVEREVMEETNMKVLHQELIGYSVFEMPTRNVKQTRSMCIVEKIGDFISDPDGEITEIKLIDPQDYKKYFDWGEIGDRIMQKALELKEEYLRNNIVL